LWGPPFRVTFPYGYAFWAAPGGAIKRRVADKPMATFKHRIRQLTRRSGGRSMVEVVERLRLYLLGWKGYFRLAQTQKVWKELEQWKRGRTIYRELIALGAIPEIAQLVAANSRRWWGNSGKALNAVLTLEWADKLRIPRLS